MIIVLLLACLVMVLVVWVLSRPEAPSAVAIARLRELELSALKERLLAQMQELESDRRDRRVDEAVATAESSRLEHELAAVLREAEGLAGTDGSASTVKVRRSPVRMAALALILTGLGGGLYAYQSESWLRSTLSPPPPPAAGATAGGAQVPPFVLQMVAKLERHLIQDPNDLKGWLTLGQSYLVLGNAPKAQDAFGHAYALAPNNPGVIGRYAWSFYSADPTVTEGKVASLYHRLYQIDPTRQDALWFLGLQAYNEHRLAVAVTYWKRLLARMPKGSKAKQGVEQVIAEVEQQLHHQKPAKRPG